MIWAHRKVFGETARSNQQDYFCTLATLIKPSAPLLLSLLSVALYQYYTSIIIIISSSISVIVLLLRTLSNRTSLNWPNLDDSDDFPPWTSDFHGKAFSNRESRLAKQS